MSAPIVSIEPASLAEKAGLLVGDILETINNEPIIDQIDYAALTANESLNLGLLRGQESFTVHIAKEEWEPLGMTLDQDVVSQPRPCKNKCVFCFIDQMPPNMRETLYVKDDDWRLSLMMGNFITMTNITDEEFNRILRRKVSPLYISVHTTDPELRVKMLKNPNANQIMTRLRILKEHNIRFHCQVVLCPGWNDGEALLRTLHDLSSLAPAASSVALVPVGLTRHREHLTQLTPFTKDTAR